MYDENTTQWPKCCVKLTQTHPPPKKRTSPKSPNKNISTIANFVSKAMSWWANIHHVFWERKGKDRGWADSNVGKRFMFWMRQCVMFPFLNLQVINHEYLHENLSNNVSYWQFDILSVELTLQLHMKHMSRRMPSISFLSPPKIFGKQLLPQFRGPLSK